MRRLAYLSGAVRVATRDDAEASGPRAHVLGVIDAFTRAGWLVDRYIAGDEPWARRFGTVGGETAARKAAWRAVAVDGVRLAACARNRAALRTRIGQVDLAYERFGSFQSLGRDLQRRGVPWVVETSGPFFVEARVERGTLALSSLARRIELGAYASCDLLVCVSEPLRSWLVDAGVPAATTFVLPNGVDVDRFDPAPMPAPVRPDELVVGFVGALLAWQGVDTLIDALAVTRARGDRVVATVIGDGPASDDLRKVAAARGVADLVRFTGRVPASDVAAMIAGFDVGFSGHLPLLDGHMYHSPLKLYEYLAMGTPLVAAEHPEAAGLVRGSGAGALFTAGDASSLADVLSGLARDLDGLRASRALARAYVVANHSWDRRVADLIAELETRSVL